MDVEMPLGLFAVAYGDMTNRERKTPRITRRNKKRPDLQVPRYDNDQKERTHLFLPTRFLKTSDATRDGSTVRLLAFRKAVLRCGARASLWISPSTQCAIITPGNHGVPCSVLRNLQGLLFRVASCHLPAPAYPLIIYDLVVHPTHFIVRWPRPLVHYASDPRHCRFMTMAQQDRECEAIASSYPFLLPQKTIKPMFETAVIRNILETYHPDMQRRFYAQSIHPQAAGG